MEIMHTMANEAIAPNPKRRFYSPELKAQVVAQCRADRASIAAVALAHGINANIVHGWRKLARETNALVLPAPSFVPVTVAAESYPPAPERQIDLELRRGPLTLKLNWPMTDTAGLAAWLRELLR